MSLPLHSACPFFQLPRPAGAVPAPQGSLCGSGIRTGPTRMACLCSTVSRASLRRPSPEAGSLWNGSQLLMGACEDLHRVCQPKHLHMSSPHGQGFLLTQWPSTIGEPCSQEKAMFPSAPKPQGTHNVTSPINCQHGHRVPPRFQVGK